MAFRPHTYLTDEWGCPDEEPIIGIPFYLADAKPGWTWLPDSGPRAILGGSVAGRTP